MTIGVFAKRTRLSLKALRLYDAMGLLPPVFVNPENGYRYYAQTQLEQAKLIGLLRQLEMPLEHIQDVLVLAPHDAVQAIACYWHGVEADVQAKRKLVRFLKSHLEDTGGIMFTVQLRDVAEQKVLSIEKRMYAPELPAFIEDSMTRLYAHIAASGLQPEGAPFVIYHGEVNVDSEGPVEVCVAFTGNLEPKDDIRVRFEAAHKEAYTRISKAQVAFPEILSAYDAVGCYIKEKGKQMGAPREVYFAEWDKLADDEPACDIAFPYTD